MNIVPQTPSVSPNYFCTWLAQCQDVRPARYPAGMDNLDAELLFDWLSRFYPEIRADLRVVIDCGWDVPRGTEPGQSLAKYGSLELDVGRFPGFTLATLHERIRSLGWRGLGVWVASQCAGDDLTQRRPDAETYWRKRAQWCREAGIDYWKVDWGVRDGDLAFRKMLKEVAGDILVEHARISLPVNGDLGKGVDEVGRYATWDDGKIFRFARELLSAGDVVRTYDVSPALSVSSTLDRVATLLQSRAGNAVLNAEDEVYLAAALGCAIGIMRFPRAHAAPTESARQAIAQAQAFIGDPHQVATRTLEAVRAVRWSRIAPAVPVNAVPVAVDDRVLVDSWIHEKGEIWNDWLIGVEVRQGSPARVARNMPLPEVSGADEPPFVVCSRHPNGATAVATLPRVFGAKHHERLPLVDVTIEADASKPVGVFGEYRSLTIRGPAKGRWWAQDLAGDEAVEITNQVRQGQIDGCLLKEIGTRPGDASRPGLVLQVIGS